MSDVLHHELFSSSRPWLENQPEMARWRQGCRRLIERLGRWVGGYSKAVCEAPVVESSKDHPRYVARIWGCLAYHWRQAAEAEPEGRVELARVAERLREGRGWRRGGRLGGDPMRDVVLALAMTLRDEHAPRVFEADYLAFCQGLASRLDRRLADDPDQWWNDLLDFLAGYTDPPGKLEKFEGKCGLRNWLGTVLWNYLRRWLSRGCKLAGDQEVNAMNPPQASVADDPATREAVQVLAELVRPALALLPDDDRLLLLLVYLDGMRQKEAAAILRVHPGNVTRRLKAAIGRLRGRVEQIAADRLRDASLDGGAPKRYSMQKHQYAPRPSCTSSRCTETARCDRRNRLSSSSASGSPPAAMVNSLICILPKLTHPWFWGAPRLRPGPQEHLACAAATSRFGLSLRSALLRRARTEPTSTSAPSCSLRRN